MTGGLPTVTVTAAVRDPVALAAVRVYLVVVLGLTLTDVPVTVPTPWSIFREVAPVTVQLRVVDRPGVTCGGPAVKPAITGRLADEAVAASHAVASNNKVGF